MATAASNKDLEYNFLESAAPGPWKIKAEIESLEEETEIFIGELAALEFDFQENEVLIKNAGNIKYTEPIEIKVKGSNFETVLTKKTSIKPGGTLNVNLEREVEAGTYDIEVQGDVFEDVYIEGTKGSFNPAILYYVLIIVLIIFLIYLFRFRPRKKIIKKLKEMHGKKGEYSLDEVKKQFNNVVLKQIEKKDKKIRKSLDLANKKQRRGREGLIVLGKDKIRKDKEEQKNKEPDSLFNMFG